MLDKEFPRRLVCGEPGEGLAWVWGGLGDLGGPGEFWGGLGGPGKAAGGSGVGLGVSAEGLGRAWGSGEDLGRIHLESPG